MLLATTIYSRLFVSDRPQIGHKSAVERLKDVLLSALFRYNKSHPVRFSKLLTKLAELRTLSDVYAKTLNFSAPNSSSPCDSDQESSSGCYEEEELPLTLPVFPNRKVAVA